MKFFRLMLIAGACVYIPFSSRAGNEDTMKTMACSPSCAVCCADEQTPVGIMTDHIHPKGQWMVSYSYMNMMMKGSRTGTRKMSDYDLFQKYAMAPETMTMQMHMLMVMYGITDHLTTMVMGCYTANHMTMKMNQQGMQMIMMNMPGMQGTTDMSSSMTSRSSGLADTRLYALYNFFSVNESDRLIGGLGVNLPTGASGVTGETLLGNNQRLAYNMQLGTGSFGLLPSLTSVLHFGAIQWGGEIGAFINLGSNAQGYKWGNAFHATAWLSYEFIPSLSASVRTEGVYTNKISGYDKKIAVLMYNDPSADAHNYGGTRMNGYLGLNYKVKKLPALQLMAEYGMPVYENLNGPQMSEKGVLQLGAQYMF